MAELYELSFAERRDWLRLTRAITIGPIAFRDLMQRFKSPQAVLKALPELARRRPIILPSLNEIEAEMQQAKNLGIRLLAYCEPDYPPLLRIIDPPPPMISLWGRTELVHQPCLAIIGSRNASAIALRFTRQIATELGNKGFTIVSGLARGIDTSAHQGALSTGTVGVLGGGIDHIYPRQNADLFSQMRTQGALISESPMGHKATARDFPRRNRLISGLCRGVIIVQAAERSGTLITARYALEQNREVMAIPGSPLDPRSKGCNRLIQQGAALVESVEDILRVLENIPAPSFMEDKTASKTTYESDEFDWQKAQNDIATATDTLNRLISPTPTPRDELIRLSGFSVAIASAALLEMEINGEIIVEADGCVSQL